MKRMILLTLVCLLMLSPCACSKPEEAAAPEESFEEETAMSEQSVGLPSPMHDATDYKGLLAAQPNNMLSDAPAGSTDVSYYYIDGEPVLSQIQFTFEENAYTYRSAAASENAQTDISGIYYDLNKSKECTVADTATALGGAYTLRYMQGSTNGLATWYYAPTGCQYSLWTETGCDNTQAIEKVAQMLLPIGFDAFGNPLDVVSPTDDPAAVVGSVTGTITALQPNVITVQLTNKSTLQFKLTNVPAINAKAGDTVTITYSGNPLDTPEALTITVIDSAPATPQPTAAPTEDPNKNADKTVTGYVTDLTNNRVSVYLNASHSYTFKYDNTTVITGNYSLAYGCRVSVLYAGYASNRPLAKRIEVLAPPAEATPTPIPTQAPTATPYNPPVYTITGTVTFHAGNGLAVTTSDGIEYNFLLRAPRITGDTSEGSLVRLTYQVEEDGTLNATDIEDITPILY